MRLWRFSRDSASHITDNLINNDMSVIVGATRVVSDDLGRSPDDGLSVKKLVATSPQAWGESSYRLKNVLPALHARPGFEGSASSPPTCRSA